MSIMPEQLDLFISDGQWPVQPLLEPAESVDATPPDLDDAALLSAIRNARQSNCLALAQEAGRRRLVAAAEELEQLCRRFIGFGQDCTIREQMAAVDGLVMIGGGKAAQAIRRIAMDQVIAGPGLAFLAEAAARLGAHLPADTVASWLHHSDPAVRANACQCARGGAQVTDVLLELLSDLNGTVAREAACALGRSGRQEARAPLMRMLQQAPSAEIIQAIEAVADEDCLVLLGRLGRVRPDLTDAVIMVLENSDSARAAHIRRTLRYGKEALS